MFTYVYSFYGFSTWVIIENVVCVFIILYYKLIRPGYARLTTPFIPHPYYTATNIDF